MSRPRGRFARSKARQGDSLKHKIPSPCPHSPPPPPRTVFTLIGALGLGRCVNQVPVVVITKRANWIKT